MISREFFCEELAEYVKVELELPSLAQKLKYGIDHNGEILTMVSDIMGILGGAFVGIIMLDISAAQYLKYSLDAFSATNFLVGLFHGLIYGIIIACCGCYYGINCGRNADSVGIATTKAVVSSIVIMIVATGFLTLIFQALRI